MSLGGMGFVLKRSNEIIDGAWAQYIRGSRRMQLTMVEACAQSFHARSFDKLSIIRNTRLIILSCPHSDLSGLGRASQSLFRLFLVLVNMSNVLYTFVSKNPSDVTIEFKDEEFDATDPQRQKEHALWLQQSLSSFSQAYGDARSSIEENQIALQNALKGQQQSIPRREHTLVSMIDTAATECNNTIGSVLKDDDWPHAAEKATNWVNKRRDSIHDRETAWRQTLQDDAHLAMVTMAARSDANRR